MHAGFIEALDVNKNLLEKVDTVVGCSIGVVVGLCWIVGMSPVEIEQTLFRLNDDSVISLKGLAMFIDKYGIDDGEYLTAFFVDILLSSGMSPNMTLLELYEAKGKRLLAVSFNLSTTQLCTLGPESHPDVRVVDALRASTAIPIGFTPFVLNGEYYVDGAIRMPYPLDIARQDAVTRDRPESTVVGCKIVTSCVGGEMRSIEEYLQRLMYVCTTTPESDEEIRDPSTFIHTVATPTTLDFAQNRSDGEQMRSVAFEHTLGILARQSPVIMGSIENVS